MCTFFFLNTKPIACNNDDKKIYKEAYVKRGNGKRKLGLKPICRRWPVIKPE